MHADIWRWSAVETAAAIRRRQISCVEAVQAAVERMRAVNARVNAVTVDLSDDALAAAKRADDIVASGVALGPLHGVPIGVQIIGQRFREDRCLDAAQVIETGVGVLAHQLWARE